MFRTNEAMLRNPENKSDKDPAAQNGDKTSKE
jgi:hypothetical protein